VDTPENSEYSADGIDLTLIRWMLSLTPPERLKVLQKFVDSVEEIRARNDGSARTSDRCRHECRHGI
jgi:hypothetical protein